MGWTGEGLRVPDDHHIRLIERHGGDLIRTPFGDPLIVIAQSLADGEEKRGPDPQAEGTAAAMAAGLCALSVSTAMV